MNLSINGSLSQNRYEQNKLNNVSFNAANNYVNLWKYNGRNDWINRITSNLSKENLRELAEAYGGPKRASSVEVLTQNIKGLFYPITKYCSKFAKFFSKNKCIKVEEHPQKHPYTREEFYSDGSKKEMEYNALGKLINMWEINKDGIPTRRIEYIYGLDNYSIELYDKNRKVTKLYYPIKYPYYPHLSNS